MFSQEELCSWKLIKFKCLIFLLCLSTLERFILREVSSEDMSEIIYLNNNLDTINKHRSTFCVNESNWGLFYIFWCVAWDKLSDCLNQTQFWWWNSSGALWWWLSCLSLSCGIFLNLQCVSLWCQPVYGDALLKLLSIHHILLKFNSVWLPLVDVV